MWVRGLKLVLLLATTPIATSHPMWVRGLKLNTPLFPDIPTTVAPYVGAWIETERNQVTAVTRTSHPMWVRGLKLRNECNCTRRKGRTLCGCVD